MEQECVMPSSTRLHDCNFSDVRELQFSKVPDGSDAVVNPTPLCRVEIDVLPPRADQIPRMLTDESHSLDLSAPPPVPCPCRRRINLR